MNTNHIPLTRRDLLKLGAVATVGSRITTHPTTSASAPAASYHRELIRDRHFQQGFILLNPKPGQRVAYAKLPGIVAPGQPVWDLAQWSSRFPLYSNNPEHLPWGGLRYANKAKSITIGPSGSQYADLSLGVNASVEYGSRARKPHEPWVHLLCQQEIADPPSLGEVSSVHFHVDARLKHSRHIKTSDYSPDVHTAQCQIFLSIQNRKLGKGFGDYLWFGLPLYDNRYRFPSAYKAEDTAGSNKYIYTCAAKDIANESTHEHKWATCNRDIIPLIHQALDAAWSRGFLKHSQQLADYHIAGFFYGWEVPGIFDVEMQIRDISLNICMKKRI